MFILRRLILWLLPIFWIVGFELIRFNHAFWLAAAIVFVVQIFFTIGFICGFKLNSSFLNFLILPFLFAGASWSIIFFISAIWLFHGLVVFSGLILYFLVRQYYLYFHLPFKYQPYSLESLSLYVSILAIFFMIAGGFGGLILVQLNILLVLAGLLPVILLVTYQFFWMHKMDLKKNWLFVTIITLILLELFWAISYLPTSYYVNSFILATAYYLMLGFSQHYLFLNLDKKKILGYIIVAACALLLVLATAQWS